ncbi:MAG TPA: patatin-like phospholipase family protein [Anaerolineaceae bacterium]|nr:patatin-like phospholipase family protein [Anaerolineaceae bacterium]
MDSFIPNLFSKPPTYRNLVFKGGGIRGIAYIGALEVLEERGILPSIERVAGTSAGAISAFLVSFRIPVSEILKCFATLDFRKVPQASTHHRKLPIPLPVNPLTEEEKLARIVRNYGLYSSSYFYQWLRSVVAEHCNGNPNATFEDFHERGFRDLYIVVANLNKHQGEIMSYHDTPQASVADAVRMSMSIPLYFEALRFDGKNFGKGDFYVDGGVYNNYPIKLFDQPPFIKSTDLKRSKGNSETLGMFLYPEGGLKIIKKEDPRNLMEYLGVVISNLYTAFETIQYENSFIDQHRTIAIPDRGILSTDFSIVKGDEKYNKLREAGRTAARAFLENL